MTDQPQQPYGQPVQQPYGQTGAPGQPIAPGQPGQPESKFGTAAYDAGAVGQPMAEPKKWGLLKTLTLVSLGIYVLSGLLAFVGLNEDSLRDQMQLQLESQGQSATPELLDAMVAGALAGGIVFAVANLVVSIALYLVVFFGLRKVKGWARVLGTVLSGLGLVLTAGGLIGIGTMIGSNAAAGIATLILSIAFIAVGVFWIVTAFSKENNAYVRSRS
jgi:hypothetical protein